MNPATGATAPTRTRGLPAFAAREVLVIAAAMAVVLVALSGRYGYHRDELYFLQAGRRPAWGYVDQPPLTPMLARLSTAVFGDTTVGLRVVPMLLTVVTVIVAALITRELGGGRGPQILTAAAVATSSMVLSVGHMLATPTTDTLIWLVICLLTLRLLRTKDPRWYLAIGLVVGVGVLNKVLVLLLAAGLVGSILAVGPRRVLASWWLLAGVGVALLVASPTILWQAAHDWPQFTVARGISEDDGVENRIMFVPGQLIYLAPPYAVLWLAGMWRLWRDHEFRWARALPVTYVLLAVLMLIVGGKPYYLIGLLIALLAAGSEPVLGWFGRRGLTWVVVAAVAVSAVISAAATLPVWPRTAVNPVNAINREQGEQIGWPELTRSVAEVFDGLPDRSHAAIFTSNYGEAGAIDRFGPDLGLPRAYSGHMSYADWGSPDDAMTGPVVIVRFPDNTEIVEDFTDCHTVAHVDNGDNVDNTEQGAAVDVCTGPHAPWSQLWPQLRHFY
ncbi:ArnT family glycosyltransferase [Gordonia rhizosphera]|uniref:Glycosyltransferase RgtA/B/C/D-like domain-containing protein n=1 Tax=Gordonia rhizosphera NBRC 16068 TaxID=1108045 RepID=K6W3V2_9ACTN|nr:glycosyltransferase family 39 protein [Gordonia rhizosphera]GAB93810.1 hypothetical protein GORHZ_245_00480 [Gordonia rhizosphera NBRC 16068]